MSPVIWRFAERLLRRAVPPRHLAPILGDLIEDYERRVAILGRIRADVWLLREAVSLAAMYRVRGRSIRVRPETWLGRLRSDVVHGWRAVRARPTATLATTAVLALGIGLVSAMFALADPYLLRPLPYTRPHELVEVIPRTFVPRDLPTLEGWRARRDLFMDLAAAASIEVRAATLESGDTILRLAPVSTNYFSVLGVPVVFPDDWRADGARSAAPLVLTSDACERLFGHSPAIGRLLRSAEPGREDLRVVDVLPSSFIPPFVSVGREFDGFVPLGDQPLVTVEVTPTGGTRGSALSTVARLRPGVAHQAVEAALSTVPNDGARAPLNGLVVLVRPIAQRTIEAGRTMALGVLTAGVLVLIVCAANVANLLLARGAARTREFAAREALGASSFDIARLVLVELALLTTVGVTAGLTVARGALAATSFVIPAQYVTLGAPGLSARVVAFACAAGGLVMLAGMMPAWAAWRVTPHALFTQTASQETRAVRALRFAMTTAQTAVAVVLLAGAALLGRSFVNLVTQDPGYDRNTYALQVSPPNRPIGGTAPRMAREDVDTTLIRLAHLPGVRHAAALDGPLVSDTMMVTFGRSITIDGRRVAGIPRRVSAGFFAATRSRLVAGRLPGVEEQERLAVVSESFAHECCGGASPLGMVMQSGDQAFEIAGVIKDVHTQALDEAPGPVVFLPLTASQVGSVTYVLRVDNPDAELALAVERQVLAVNHDARVSDASTMRQRLMRSINDRSFATLVAVFFAVAAIGVSAAGLVGVVGFVVARRTREVAIRVAIGATARDVIRLVTSEATLAAASGACSGLVAAWWLSRTIQNLLYGITPADPVSFAVAATVVVLMVMLAAWLPARRATRLSPTVALRAE